MKPFLILQARPETDASDQEFAAILDKCGLAADRARRIRVDAEDIPDDLRLEDFAGVIVGGGPGCVSDDPASKDPGEARVEAQLLTLVRRIVAADHPYMGCCYGLGLLTAALGGEMSKERYGEPVGAVMCEITLDGAADPLLAGLPPRFEAFVGHKEAVQSDPPGTVRLVGSSPCPFQMIRYGTNVYATQFHPEADAAVFEGRIRIYRNHGYFPPEDADRLIAACHAADVTVPGDILRRFVERYA